MNNRFELLKNWIATVLKKDDFNIELVSGDASFRKYYRVENLIFVDAPPQTEKNADFVKFAEIYLKHEILVPKVIAYDLEQGFLCISDLGNTLFSQYINEQNLDRMYLKATELAVKISKIDYAFPIYDEPFIKRELQIFSDWYIKEYAGVSLNEEELAIWQKTEKLLVQNDLEQPQSTMHRDFHCRNIMIEDQDNLAVIDFQDTVTGPITYDLVSLVKDCYITLDDSLRARLIEHAYKLFKFPYDQSTFIKYLDLTGMQRHLKAIGIFCRLKFRDQKDQYLQYLPRTFGYVEEVANKYEELQDFAKLLKNKFTKR